MKVERQPGFAFTTKKMPDEQCSYTPAALLVVL